MTTESKKPITEKQKQARRENGKKSRGPTSDEGKARSAQNATKHGCYARLPGAIETGPLREDIEELEAFIRAYVIELDPGASLILTQAALDVADKAWRLTRAQRWETQGFTLADYGTQDAARAAWLRDGARRDRRNADTVRSISDRDNASREALSEAYCRLGFATGLSEEDLAWVEDADTGALLDRLSSLVGEYFENQEGAASYLEAKASAQDQQAESIETTWRPSAIRRELDSSFARNAERLVSHASREYDRSLRRYERLRDQIGENVDSELGEGEDDLVEDWADPNDGASAPTPAEATDDPAEEPSIFDYHTADEVVDYLTSLFSPKDSEPPPRNEPTDKGGDV